MPLLFVTEYSEYDLKKTLVMVSLITLDYSSYTALTPWFNQITMWFLP